MLDANTNSGCGCESISTQQDLMSIGEALHVACQGIKPINQTVRVPLAKSLGRTATVDIHAPHAMPFFDNSAMDGFAVSSADFEGDAPWILPLGETVAAGETGEAIQTTGKATRIFTGAPVPKGCDAVVMVEQTTENAKTVSFSHAPRVGDNIRRMGSDMPAGARLIKAGTKIAARHIGILAANGFEYVEILRPLRIGVLSTGDELAKTDRGAGQIYDSNRPMLIALAECTGANVTDLGILPDTLEATKIKLQELSGNFDLILSSGAVSMGGRDHLRPAFEAAGGDIGGWRVALKPGKPVMFGRIGNTVFTGLPGNPFAAFVGFHIFVSAQIERMTGSPKKRFSKVEGVANFNWRRHSGRSEVFPVAVTEYDDDGTAVLERLGNSVSATLFPLTEADGLAIVPATTSEVKKGDQLFWQPFDKD